MIGIPLVLSAILVAASVIIFLILLCVQQVLNTHQKEWDKTAASSLQSMYIFVDSRRLFAISVLSIILVPIVLFIIFENPIIPILGTIATFLAPKIYIKRRQRLRIELFEKQLPDALLMVSGGMRAGASLAVAMESMTRESKPPLAQEFALMLSEQRLGVEFDIALSHMENRLPLPDFVLLVAAMRITREVGGNFADILETLSVTLRRKHEMEGKIKALTAQGRLQGIVMAALPLGLMGILTKMEPEAMAPLYHTGVGWLVLLVIFVMVAIGYGFIRKIVNIDV